MFSSGFAKTPLKVVTTLTTYADIAEKIGGKYVTVKAIAPGNQDAHFIRPKPSYARMVSEADIFVTTGLDLELWAPVLIDMAKNPHIRSGEKGYVAVSEGIELLEKPENLSRSEGDIHIFGNPHIVTSPINLLTVAHNIMIGLINNAPEQESYFRSRYEQFRKDMLVRLVGNKILNILGEDAVIQLIQTGKLIPFLRKKEFQGKKLIHFLDGWMKTVNEFYGKKIVAYHKNWVYLTTMCGLHVIGYMEPKPGIPPSPKHVAELIDRMKNENVKVMLAANYFSPEKIRLIREKTDAIPVVVPLYVNGSEEAKDIYSLLDLWFHSLAQAFRKSAQED
jgi:ABC-type Zn uptake system ZnuABC Zn-binding protein ZnuA